MSTRLKQLGIYGHLLDNTFTCTLQERHIIATYINIPGLAKIVDDVRAGRVNLGCYEFY